MQTIAIHPDRHTTTVKHTNEVLTTPHAPYIFDLGLAWGIHVIMGILIECS